MSEIAGELARVNGAFDQPTLTLLHQRQAPVVITLFRSAFGRDNRPIPTARLHTQVEEHLAALALAGETEVPTGSGRDLCQKWMRGQWLVRSLDERGNEVYTLTSHAQQALELVKNLTRDRATLSEHRITTILGTVRRFNSEANPDRTTRVTILNEEIARLQAERDRLVDGAEMVSATEDWMSEGFTELLSLISALPSDFARVEERFAQIRTEILAAFRAEDRPAGEVIDAYLERADALMTATHEGRAFEGAFALLRDDALVAQLRDDLGALLDHPLSDRILGDVDRAELRGTVKLVRDGLDRVLTQRSRVTATLKEYIVSHDAARDRELEQTLRQVEAEMTTWMANTGPRATHDVPMLPQRTSIDHLREKFYDPADDVLPERIERDPVPDAPTVSLSALMAQGGPQLGTLRQRLDEALAGLSPAASLGDFFDSLEPSLRRPVEIFGLLHLAADRGWAVTDETETYAALRNDGTGRTFTVPRLPLPDPDLDESESPA
ncbi:DUF3375 domain-containing protein [Nocardioides daphniae]|uniref:DUF3375 domain-containing protein n=1 Tax=Nocardioides daphniae TaxID=402297 RepID=A0A4P7UBL4_9ACTN|nr:DUF3375 domain-containing protein [Nocardioides daphniae]QCC77562.1 DUF3375 domain-containing protein [Nocardioides daphniae]GGD30765.1 hypothetical protein GCM10007231_32810 [Nocardioides daphniae]